VLDGRITQKLADAFIRFCMFSDKVEDANSKRVKAEASQGLFDARFHWLNFQSALKVLHNLYPDLQKALLAMNPGLAMHPAWNDKFFAFNYVLNILLSLDVNSESFASLGVVSSESSNPSNLVMVDTPNVNTSVIELSEVEQMKLINVMSECMRVFWLSKKINIKIQTHIF